MSVFFDYSRYYDLLYRDKNYAAEADFIDRVLVEKSGGRAREILNLGCGTGGHDLLLEEKGYKVTGADLSGEMIRIARAKAKEAGSEVEYHESSIQELSLGRKFDAVTALFHVFSYQNEPVEIAGFFDCARAHLKPGGLLFFDFWYGPAVLAQRPERRMKHMEGEGLRIEREAIPTLHLDRNVVDVNYRIHVEGDAGKKAEIEEKHPMRYFFLPELREYAANHGFQWLGQGEWLTGAAPTEKSWGVYVVWSR